MPRNQASPSLSAVQAELPLLTPRGAKHARDCRCPRCRGWVEDPQAVQLKAELTLARRRERRKAKALALRMELAAGEEATDRYLRQQAEIAERLKEDHRLEVLLAARNAGKPIAEAIADVERRFATRRSNTG